MADEMEWTDAELDAAVKAYSEMVLLELAGTPYSKSEHRRRLLAGPLAGRSSGSVEYRMQNISYVMDLLGRPRISGYKPAGDVGPANEARLRRIIETSGGAPSSEALERLADVVSGSDEIIGVKAVFGPLSSHVLCFGARGTINDKSYFQVAAGAAKRATTRPYVITIGGGKNVQKGYEGRVLNVARLALVYGLTSTLITDPEEVGRLAQWPVAIALHDVWRFAGAPRLVEDLGFADRTILGGSQDGIVHPEQAMKQLWAALHGLPVERVGLPLPGNFYDSGKPRLVTARLPTIPASGAEEGARVLKQQLAVERDRRLAREVKHQNRMRYGAITCEACGFTHKDGAMFDVHHPTPLAIGKRTTLPEHLLVLCPTCHRRAHRKSASPLDPYTLHELKEWVADGRA
ncbi:HNH endonuclease [Methylopila sp. Yamaguchi]|uniref:HNH endonuclease n=1 Tax=Methylopila sp. Yamaguchi TaxID=1437817 RepID=UPI000CCB4BDB|nr:HNH endonuclease [Methylopila sp. Yamaguchi]GBD47035.1 hypothetical protein METY_0248 [Methylopila sp. Yamaguchi]